MIIKQHFKMKSDTITQEELDKITSDWIDEQGDTLQCSISLTVENSEEFNPKEEAQKWAKVLPNRK